MYLMPIGATLPWQFIINHISRGVHRAYEQCVALGQPSKVIQNVQHIWPAQLSTIVWLFSFLCCTAAAFCIKSNVLIKMGKLFQLRVNRIKIINAKAGFLISVFWPAY